MRQPSRKLAFGLLPFSLLLAASVVMTGCGDDGVGDRCQETKECWAGLVCDIAEGPKGVCRRPKDAKPARDAAATPLDGSRDGAAATDGATLDAGADASSDAAPADAAPADGGPTDAATDRPPGDAGGDGGNAGGDSGSAGDGGNASDAAALDGGPTDAAIVIIEDAPTAR